MKVTRRLRTIPKHDSSLLLQVFDQADECVRNLATLAAQLEGYGSRRPTETLDPEFLSHAGMMMGREVRRLREIVKRLEQTPTKANREKQ